jgi:hypothetical protein
MSKHEAYIAQLVGIHDYQSGRRSFIQDLRLINFENPISKIRNFLEYFKKNLQFLSQIFWNILVFKMKSSK